MRRAGKSLCHSTAILMALLAREAPPEPFGRLHPSAAKWIDLSAECPDTCGRAIILGGVNLSPNSMIARVKHDLPSTAATCTLRFWLRLKGQSKIGQGSFHFEARFGLR